MRRGCPQFVSDLLPASDGLYLGNDLRRWNLLLKKILSGEEPTAFIDGKLWFYDVDKHPYIEESGVGFTQILLAGDPPSQHGNEVHFPLMAEDPHGNASHSPSFLATYLLNSSYYNSADISVGSASAVTLASITCPAGYYYLPLGGFNFRANPTNTANRILSVWWEVGTTQRSAKFPITAVLNETKRPFTIENPLRNVTDLNFWRTKFASTTSINLRAQTDAETVIVSDRWASALQVG